MKAIVLFNRVVALLSSETAALLNFEIWSMEKYRVALKRYIQNTEGFDVDVKVQMCLTTFLLDNVCILGVAAWKIQRKELLNMENAEQFLLNSIQLNLWIEDTFPLYADWLKCFCTEMRKYFRKKIAVPAPLKTSSVYEKYASDGGISYIDFNLDEVEIL